MTKQKQRIMAITLIKSYMYCEFIGPSGGTIMTPIGGACKVLFNGMAYL